MYSRVLKIDYLLVRTVLLRTVIFILESRELGFAFFRDPSAIFFGTETFYYYCSTRASSSLLLKESLHQDPNKATKTI